MVEVKQNVGWVTIYVAHGMLRAMVIRGALESAGIPVELSYESVPTSARNRMDLSSDVRVLVPQEWYAEAHALLTSQPPLGEIFSVPKE